MKYKEFKEKMEQMDLTVGENEYAIWVTTPRQKGKIVVVAKDLRFRVTVPHHLLMEDAAKLEGVLINATRLSCTPLEEREEEEKKYIYRFDHNVSVDDLDNYAAEINKPYYLDRHKDGEKNVMLDSSGQAYAMGHPSFHFTDREVEQYTGKERALFDACVKEEVQ